MSTGYRPLPRKDAKPQWEKDAFSSTFWQSLGKALGWKECVRGCFKGGHDYCGGFHVPMWKAKAREFYDLILQGEDTQAFWDDLLGK